MKSFDQWFAEQGSSPKESEQEVHYEEVLYDPNMEVKVLKRPGKKDVLIPVRSSLAPSGLKWDVYEEKWYNGILWTRIGERVHWNDEFGSHDLSLLSFNSLARQYPLTYPEFEE